MNYTGIVTGGGRKARELGFPTINIPLTDTEVSGIYAGTVSYGGEAYAAVVYADQMRSVLEAHLLNFNQDIYGHEVAITLTRKIRDSQHFATDEELKEAIARDVAQVQEG